MVVEHRDLLVRPRPRTLIVPIEPVRPAHVPEQLNVSWGGATTGVSGEIELIEFEDLLTIDELHAIAEGEAQIAQGEFITLNELEGMLDE